LRSQVCSNSFFRKAMYSDMRRLDSPIFP
jgi:hypothetical protein